MTFGPDLWDQWRTVEDYSRSGCESLEKLSDFVRKRAEIEHEYGKALGRLAKRYRDDLNRKVPSDRASFTKAVQSSSSGQAWLQLLIQTEAVATARLDASEKMEKDLGKSIREQTVKNYDNNKEIFSEIRKEIGDLKRAVDHLDKLRVKYEQASKDRDAAREAYEKVKADKKATKLEEDKMKQDAEKKAALALAAMEEYTQTMVETNSKKNDHYTRILPELLDRAQKADENDRIQYTKATMSQLAQILTAVVPIEQGACESMSSTFSTINPQYDSDLFVKLIRTGETLTVPGDYKFEEKALSNVISPKRMSAFAKTMTRSPVKADKVWESVSFSFDLDGVRSAMSLLGPGNSTRYSHRLHVRNDFGSTTAATMKGSEEHLEDSIIALGQTSKAKRKSVERIKALEKDLAELEKKIHGIESMKAANSTKPESERERTYQTLEEQRRNIEEKRDAVLYKRYKLQCFIAQMDGTPSPQLPASLEERALERQFGTTGTQRGVVSTFSSTHVPLSRRGTADTARSFGGSDEEVGERFHSTASSEEDIKRKPSMVPTVEEEESGGGKVLSRMSSVRGKALPPPPIATGSSSSLRDVIGRGRALYDFDAQPDSEEIAFKAGDVLDILEKLDDGWWKARARTSSGKRREGFVPGNYLEEV
ncbi:hypothetical protein BJ742DRAFT_785038 [Cladochytrium replicatum]|nr:hypothetical protein BJ742DRAFT_785038 [Cladochytrium replicatum]